MLTSIVKATRAHYAALQHKPSSDRIALDYEVTGHTSGTVYVKAPTDARRKAEMTKLMNRLRTMYPEAREFSTEYRDAPSKTPMLDGQAHLQQLRRALSRSGDTHLREVNEPASWAAEVTADSSGKYCGNSVRFQTRREAELYALDLKARWMLVTAWRVVPSTDKPNYRLIDGSGLEAL